MDPPDPPEPIEPWCHRCVSQAIPETYGWKKPVCQKCFDNRPGECTCHLGHPPCSYCTDEPKWPGPDYKWIHEPVQAVLLVPVEDLLVSVFIDLTNRS